VSVKIRMKRFGTTKKPYYRVVIMDTLKPRDGEALEEVGLYHPTDKEETQFTFNEERIREWINKGAVPSDTVRRLLNKKNFRIK
jgi:small subunit ribosomal protein S16